MRNSEALTKIQSIALISMIIVAAAAGSAAYVILNGPTQATENIIIGVCADLDMDAGEHTFEGATLAAEQINAQGGIQGHNITIVAEDDDSETPPYDVTIANNALTKLITKDKVDFIISTGGTSASIAYSYQDICAEHKKIMFSTVVAIDQVTQRVLDDYGKYKYFFRSFPTNSTTVSKGMLGDIITVGKYTGFTKVAFLFQDFTISKAAASYLNETLPRHGFQIVYSNLFSRDSTDFTSYFAAAEAAGAEIVVPFIAGQAGASFVKEWYERQSPTVLWGVMTAAGDSSFWNLTEGRCNTISIGGSPIVSGYPFTNKTVPAREAYIQRWGKVPNANGIAAYDSLRFILPDAINRAGTTETEAVIKALEKTNLETSLARHFTYTSSHDVMVGSDTLNNPNADYMVIFIFQWQNGKQVPVRPEEIMKEAAATYMYPPWPGPWSSKTTP